MNTPETQSGSSLQRVVRRREKYTVKSFARGRSFHIVDETGLPIYDGAPHGKDKPVIFHDEDAAIECCDELNANVEDESPNTKCTDGGPEAS